MENRQQLKSYRLNQNIVGDFEWNESTAEEPMTMTGEYRIKMNTDIINRSSYEVDLYSLVRGHAFMDVEGADRAFDRLNMNLRAEIISVAGDGIYVRLNTFNLTADNVKADEKEDYLEFKEELEQKLETIRYIWFYFPTDILEAANTENLPTPLRSKIDQEAIREQLKEKGLKETYKSLLTDIAEEEVMSEDELTVAKELIDELFSTDFFTRRTVVAGPQKGFTNFTINKRRVTDFIISVARRMGEKITSNDKTELWNMLNKFYLSAMTHENEDYGIFDFFRIKLILKNLNPLNQLSIYYSYKISNINDADPINIPDEFMSYEALELPFLPVRRNEDACMGNEPDDCLPPQTLE